MGWRDALKEWPPARKVVRWWRARTNAYPRWRHHGRSTWLSLPVLPLTAPRVLVATSVGAYLPGAGLESLIGAALVLRGARVDALLCDGVLPACSDCLVSWYPDIRRFVERGPQPDLCGSCFQPAASMYQRLGIELRRYGDLLTESERHDAERLARELPATAIATYRHGDISVGEHAVAAALRFYARGDLRDEPHGEAVLRRFFHAALLTVSVMRRLLTQERYDVLVVHHGIYVPMGILGAVCRASGVRVVNWNPAYRKRCFIFSHDDTYHHTLMDEPAAAWEEMSWGPAQEEELLTYLKSRWQGAQDWISFHSQADEDVASIAREFGVDFSRPCIGLLTNVVWDAQLFYPSNAFHGMLDWLLETIRYFAKRPDLQLLIRIHPAEVRSSIPSRQRAVDEIRRAVPTLPANIIVIPPESRVSTYAAMLQCNAVIIYGTKTGVELTSLGRPVIVAGEAWIRNKGVTLDAKSRDHYFAILESLPLSARELDPATVRRARRYAYHFFFRRMIPVTSVTSTGGWPPFQVNARTPADLAPGVDPGLDVICDGILSRMPFIYPAERAE